MGRVENISAPDALLKGLLDLMPFKGKGELRRGRDEAWALWQETHRRMKDLAQQFRGEFAASLPLNLVLTQRTGRASSTLRWRRRGKGVNSSLQTTIQLLGPAGEPILNSLPLEIRKAFLTYEGLAQSLNAAGRLHYNRYFVLDEYLAKLEAWEAQAGKS